MALFPHMCIYNTLYFELFLRFYIQGYSVNRTWETIYTP